MGGTYNELKHTPSGLCVDISGASKSGGARAVLWNCHGGDNQKFQWTDDRLKNKNSGLFLHGGAGSNQIADSFLEQRAKDNATSVPPQSSGSGRFQGWQRDGDKWMSWVLGNPRYCMAVKGNAVPGTPVGLAHCDNNSQAQKFSMV